MRQNGERKKQGWRSVESKRKETGKLVKARLNPAYIRGWVVFLPPRIRQTRLRTAFIVPCEESH